MIFFMKKRAKNCITGIKRREGRKNYDWKFSSSLFSLSFSTPPYIHTFALSECYSRLDFILIELDSGEP